MDNLDLLGMSKDELLALREQLAKTIDGYDARKKAQARTAVETLAKEHGYSLSELLEAGISKGAKKGTPKYANPSNADQTWTGRGPKPGWVKAHLETGGELTQLAIA